MTSVSDMVNNFLQAEEKNFSLFNFVNELNRWVRSRLTAHARRPHTYAMIVNILSFFLSAQTNLSPLIG